MKHALFVLIYSCCLVVAPGQSNYKEAIQQGDDAFKRKEYKKAINLYFAAEAFDPSKKEIVKGKVNEVFDRIVALQREADKSKKEAQELLKKSEKLIGTFYFYADRFALAYRSPGVNRAGIQLFIFYYIDQNGDHVEEFGEWEEAGPFKESGFAKVKDRYKPIHYIIDTFGHKYITANKFNDLDSTIQALDVSEVRDAEDSLFIKITNQVQLQALIMNGSYYIRRYVFTLPGTIGHFKNLEHLQSAYCSIDSISPEIGELKKLTLLNLRFNSLDRLPARFRELQNLATLDLSVNKFTHLPIVITELRNLQTLNLSANELTSIPAEIGNLNKLKKLDLSRNKISKNDIDKIRRLLPRCEIKY